MENQEQQAKDAVAAIVDQEAAGMIFFVLESEAAVEHEDHTDDGIKAEIGFISSGISVYEQLGYLEQLKYRIMRDHDE